MNLLFFCTYFFNLSEKPPNLRKLAEQAQQISANDQEIAQLKNQAEALQDRLNKSEEAQRALKVKIAKKKEALAAVKEETEQQAEQLTDKDQTIAQLTDRVAGLNIHWQENNGVQRLLKAQITQLEEKLAASSSQAASSVPVVARSTATQFFCRKMLSTCVQIKTDLETEAAGDFKQGALLLIRQIEVEIQEIDDSSLDAYKARISDHLGAFWALAQASEDQKDLLESYIDTFKMDLR